MIVYTKDSSRITRELSLFNQQSSSGFYFWLILKKLPLLKYFLASVIEQYTGVSDYDAHDDQIKNICKQIYKRTYPDMKRRMETINLPDRISGSTNFFLFLERFENDNTNWISEINRYIKN